MKDKLKAGCGCLLWWLLISAIVSIIRYLIKTLVYLFSYGIVYAFNHFLYLILFAILGIGIFLLCVFLGRRFDGHSFYDTHIFLHNKLFKKKLYKDFYNYNKLERIPLNINDILNGQHSSKFKCKFVGSSIAYNFYTLIDNGNTSVLVRQLDNNCNYVEYIGSLDWDFSDLLIQIVNGRYVFCTAKHARMLKSYNVFDGASAKHNWFGKGRIFVEANGYGHYFEQDSILNCMIKDNKLLLKIKRVKSNVPSDTNQNYDRDYDMIYYIVAEPLHDINHFLLSYYYPNNGEYEKIVKHQVDYANS